jgi:hypothetical protein
MRRSVTTITESNTVTSLAVSPINWCDNQAMEFDLPEPAECWIRTRRPAPHDI